MKSGYLFCRRAIALIGHVFCLAVVALSSVAAHSQVDEPPLTLSSAVARALDRHPNLQIFDLRQRAVAGERRSAALRPDWQLEAEVESFAGTGEMQGFDTSEQTLALSSVIELGGKRSARVAVIDARANLLIAERQVQALDLISSVTREFVRTLATQERVQLARSASELADTTLQVVRRRAAAGAAPEAEVLRAEVAKTQAELGVARVQQELQVQRAKLAALLNVTTAEFGLLTGDLFQLAPADDFEQLYQRALDNPVMKIFADERRLRDAELQLARSRSRSDLTWRFGLRRLEETGDTGLVASLSVPLFTGERNRGAVETAYAERDQVEYQKQEAMLWLHAQLFEAYAYREQSIATVHALQEQIIPALTEALQITARAYESGRYSYIDWITAQRELLNAQQSLIDEAAAALSYGAVIEQFTAEPLSAADAFGTDGQK